MREADASFGPAAASAHADDQYDDFVAAADVFVAVAVAADGGVEFDDAFVGAVGDGAADGAADAVVAGAVGRGSISLSERSMREQE